MIDAKTLEGLELADQKLQAFARDTFNKKCESLGLSDADRAILWDLGVQAGASYGALETAKKVNEGWKDAAERARISNSLLLRKK